VGWRNEHPQESVLDVGEIHPCDVLVGISGEVDMPRKNTKKAKKSKKTHDLTKYNQDKNEGTPNSRPTPGTAKFAENALSKLIKSPEDLEIFREIVGILNEDRTLKLNMLEMRDYALMEMVQHKYLRFITDISEDELSKLENNPNIQKMVQKIWDVKRQIRSDCAKRDSTGTDRSSLGKVLDDIDGEYEVIDEEVEEIE
jgi:hypothetical protein